MIFELTCAVVGRDYLYFADSDVGRNIMMLLVTSNNKSSAIYLDESRIRSLHDHLALYLSARAEARGDAARPAPGGEATP